MYASISAVSSVNFGRLFVGCFGLRFSVPVLEEAATDPETSAPVDDSPSDDAESESEKTAKAEDGSSSPSMVC